LRPARPLQLVLASGLALMVGGLTLLGYFTYRFDTWVSAHISAPPGVDVAHDPVESVLYESADLAARAGDGRRDGLALLGLGALLAVAGGGGLLVAGRRTGGAPGP